MNYFDIARFYKRQYSLIVLKVIPNMFSGNFLPVMSEMFLFSEEYLLLM